MYKFGTRPPRMLESFGVSGLLGEECRVFYENLFSTRHVGRVSDLLAARLRNAKADELRLRTLLLFGIFEAYLPQAPQNAEDALPEPLSLECGIDNEKIAIGVTYNLPEGVNIDFQGLGARITTRKPKGRVESLLTTLVTHAHRVIVRTEPATRRVEVVSVLGIAGKMEAQYLTEAHTIDVLIFDQAPQEAPQPTAYIEMGDLDYPELLRDENSLGEQLPPSSTGEFLVQATARNQEAPIRVRGGDTEEDSETLVRGSAPQSDSFKKLVRGNAPNSEADETITFSGPSAKTEERKKTIIKGTTDAGQDHELTVLRPDSSAATQDNGPSIRLEETSTSDAPASDYRMISAGDESKKEKKTSSFLKRLGLGKNEEDNNESQPGVNPAVLEAQAKAYQDQIRALEKKIAYLEKTATPYKPRDFMSKLAPIPGFVDENVSEGSNDSSYLVDAAQRASEKLWNQGENTGALEQQSEETGSPENAQTDPSESSEKQKEKKSLLKQIWPFKKKEEEQQSDLEKKGQESSSESSSESLPTASGENSLTGSVPAPSGSALPDEALGVDNLEDASDKLVKEIETGHFNSVITNARREAAALESESLNAKTKKWMDGLMGELVAEKSRLHAFAKKLNVTIHRKEYQFRVKHSSYQEEIRRKDDTIRQKTMAFDRLKEQVNQASMTIERLKNAKQTSSGEEVLLKQKLMQTQALLNSAKEETQQLQSKLEELKKSNGVVQGSTKNRMVSYDEMNSVKTQLDRAQRQAEEFKKANQLLMDRLNESKKDRGTSNASMEEMKKKLEAAMKMSTSSKRDIDRYSQRTEALQKEEMRLKIELGRAMEEIKKLKIEKAQSGLTRPMGRGKAPVKGPASNSGKGTSSAA